MKHFKWLLLTITLIILFCISLTHATGWKQLVPGIEYRSLDSYPLSFWSHIHVFKIDLKKNKLDLVTAQALSQPAADVVELAKKSHALIAVNAGFFDNRYQPLGLRVDHEQQTNPLKKISWWGIFYTKHQKAYVTNVSHYTPHQDINFALQSGPRLLINGNIPHLKPGLAERTALGITPEGKIILLITENAALTTTQLAHMLRAAPLNCVNAINLDGGSSSQVYAKIKNFKLHVQGFAKVSDAVVVTPWINSPEFNIILPKDKTCYFTENTLSCIYTQTKHYI